MLERLWGRFAAWDAWADTITAAIATGPVGHQPIECYRFSDLSAIGPLVINLHTYLVFALARLAAGP